MHFRNSSIMIGDTFLPSGFRMYFDQHPPSRICDQQHSSGCSGSLDTRVNISLDTLDVVPDYQPCLHFFRQFIRWLIHREPAMSGMLAGYTRAHRTLVRTHVLWLHVGNVLKTICRRIISPTIFPSFLGVMMCSE
jgi:hypothetical protein